MSSCVGRCSCCEGTTVARYCVLLRGPLLMLRRDLHIWFKRAAPTHPEGGRCRTTSPLLARDPMPYPFGHRVKHKQDEKETTTLAGFELANLVSPTIPGQDMPMPYPFSHRVKYSNAEMIRAPRKQFPSVGKMRAERFELPTF